MDGNRTCAFSMNRTTTELKRGSADYWIVYATAGEVEFAVGVNICSISVGYAAVIAMSNQDVQVKASNDFRGWMFGIGDATSAELVRRYLLLMNISDEEMNVIMAGKQHKNIVTVFEKLENTPFDDHNRKWNLLEELMIRLYRACPKAMAGPHANRTEIVADVRSRLEKEYSQEFSLAGIATEYNMSVSYLAHLFKDTTGVSIMRYLLNCRVFAAKEYLSQTIVPVKEIAEMCGFNDASNFGRTFKKETGYSPRQYRNKYAREKSQEE